jgi:hypothetical protein
MEQALTVLVWAGVIAAASIVIALAFGVVFGG